MIVLGLSAGNAGGSAEILLKQALKSAKQAGATAKLVRADDLTLTLGPDAAADGDRFWNELIEADELMEADALIVSTPIYPRTIPGKLRLLGDKTSGPQADVAFTSDLLRMRPAGVDIPMQSTIAERGLRPRVGATVAVGGSLGSYWKTFALPLMHTLTASVQVGIVDQVQFAAAGSPASIVLDDSALTRVAQLGRTVAEQAGRDYDDIEYRGAAGACPMCHLDVIAIVPGGVECVSYGAAGRRTRRKIEVRTARTSDSPSDHEHLGTGGCCRDLERRSRFLHDRGAACDAHDQHRHVDRQRRAPAALA